MFRVEQRGSITGVEGGGLRLNKIWNRSGIQLDGVAFSGITRLDKSCKLARNTPQERLFLVTTGING